MEEVITSVKNNLVVKTKKIRDNFEGQLFLDNPKTIEEAFKTNKKIEYVLIDVKKKEELLNKFGFFKTNKNCFSF